MVTYLDKIQLRQFQKDLRDAVIDRVAMGKKSTVGYACPGIGKTLAYQVTLTEMMRRGWIRFGAIYTPRILLANAAEVDWYAEDKNGRPHGKLHRDKFDARCRLERIRHKTNKPPFIPPHAKHEAFVSTFSALTTDTNSVRHSAKLHKAWAKEHDGEFALILDEAQLLGIDETGGDSVQAAEILLELHEHAAHTVVLVGYKYRADKNDIILADYIVDKNTGRRKLVADATSDYSDGISQEKLRYFEVTEIATHYTWRDKTSGETTEYDTSDPDQEARLSQVLREPAVWQPIVDGVCQKLLVAKKIYPYYRALLAGMEQKDAKEIGQYLKAKWSGLPVHVSISEDGELSTTIALQFRAEKAGDILSTVRKAYIGYDCPQITVMGILTNYRDWGHLLQLVGRGLRVMDPGKYGISFDAQKLELVVPDDPWMQKFIKYLKIQRDDGMKRRVPGGTPPESSSGPRGEIIDAYESGRTLDGNRPDIPINEDAASIQAAQELLTQRGKLNIFTTGDLLALVRDFEKLKAAPVQNSRNEEVPKTEADLVEEIKGEAAGLLGPKLNAIGIPPTHQEYQEYVKDFRHWINESFGIRSTKQITTRAMADRYKQHVESAEATKWREQSPMFRQTVSSF